MQKSMEQGKLGRKERLVKKAAFFFCNPTTLSEKLNVSN